MVLRRLIEWLRRPRRPAAIVGHSPRPRYGEAVLLTADVPTRDGYVYGADSLRAMAAGTDCLWFDERTRTLRVALTDAQAHRAGLRPPPPPAPPRAPSANTDWRPPPAPAQGGPIDPLQIYLVAQGLVAINSMRNADCVPPDDPPTGDQPPPGPDE